MNLRLLVDMNLAPSWVKILRNAGFEAEHWSRLGSPCAPDSELFGWARSHGYIVFTHDLDFGAMLNATQAESPSVFQIRKGKYRANPASNHGWRQVPNRIKG